MVPELLWSIALGAIARLELSARKSVRATVHWGGILPALCGTQMLEM